MPSTARAPSRTSRIARFVAKAAVAAFGVFLALLLGLRVVVYPQIEARRADIAHWLGTRIGEPVEIDDIVTGWNGWNPRLSIRGFRVRDAANAATLLELPRVDVAVAWTSIPRLDLRLSELTIDAPRLSVRRDTSGRLHVAGFEIPDEAAGDDSAFGDWLLRQPQVVVRDALVSWNDEMRHAPQLILDHVQFRLVQRGGRHQAGLTGVPPPELAAPIDVRADVEGASVKDVASLAGRLYVRLDYADVGAWREWLPLPFTLESGRGALRLWADFAHGQARAVTADLELADVQATLSHELSPLALAHMTGRVQWKQDGAQSTFAAKNLAFALPDGSGVGPTNVTLSSAQPAQGAHGGGTLAFGALDLAPLAAIAAHLPLPDAARSEIARLAPRGAVRDGRIDWTGAADAPTRYSLRAQLHDLAVASHGNEPGVSGLSGSIALDERGGELSVDGANVSVVLPEVFADTLAFDRVRGVVSWTHDGANTSVAWRDVEFANADVAGTTAGRWASLADSPGEIDMQARITHASLVTAHRYVPVAAAASLREWLRHGVGGGTTSDARLTLQGDLAHFPFRDKRGRFELAVKADDATLTYAERWLPITNVSANVRIDGPRVTVDATRGRMGDIAIGATHAEIADFHEPLLRVDGRASGPTRAFLAFIAATPVSQWIGHATDNIVATGDGRLELTLGLPLHDLEKTTVSGRYLLAKNDVQIPGMPLLAAAAGELAFSGRELRGSGITAQALGGGVRLSLAADGTRVHVDGAGNADLALVRQAFDIPILAHLQGTADYKLALDTRDGDVAWSVESSLAGTSVDLPAPLQKAAAIAVPLRVERKPVKAGEDRISVDYGRIAKVILRRRATDKAPIVDRALVLLGNKVATDNADATQPGAWIRANVAALDVDAWLDATSLASSPSTGDRDALRVAGIDVQADKVSALGRTFSDVKATARRRGDDWRFTFDGPELAGSAQWHAPSAEQRDPRIVAHLTRLVASGDDSPLHDAAAPGEAKHWPAVDLVADNLVRKGRSIGRLEVHAQPSGADWQIRKLVLANDAGSIEAQGSWRAAAMPPQTSLDITIDVKEAGAFLGHFGWPDAVKGAATKIVGQVSWQGAPSDFDYPTLGGRLALRAAAGQFTKLEPGVGRLLGVLSLQALPRRITLDFRDVFSQGFAFDTIAGNVRIDAGVMHTDDLRLVGPAAAVDLAGDVDLAHETQQMQVRVQPSLSTGVSAGAAALFIANPLIGAAVGAGTLIAQKMLNNPFDQLFSYRYSVTGTFDDPVVARRTVAATSAESAAVR